MRKTVISILLLFFAVSGFCNAGEHIPLPVTSQTAQQYEQDQQSYFSSQWNTNIVTNVSSPSLEAFLPAEDVPAKSAIIIAPGGALYALSIDSEGNDVARWLAKKGIAAFVLRYRLVPTPDDATAQLSRDWEKSYDGVLKKAQAVLPHSIDDGLAAVRYVREHADTYNIDPEKIGFMGFSAGGAVALGVAYHYKPATRPNFLIPVYPWTDVIDIEAPKTDAPPMIIVGATNDNLGLAKGAARLYLSYIEADKNAALHLYSQGGHGFGMKKQGLPSDSWIQQVYDWLVAEKWTSAR